MDNYILDNCRRVQSEIINAELLVSHLINYLI